LTQLFLFRIRSLTTTSYVFGRMLCFCFGCAVVVSIWNHIIMEWLMRMVATTMMLLLLAMMPHNIIVEVAIASCSIIM
jgi:hypothetical protein